MGRMLLRDAAELIWNSYVRKRGYKVGALQKIEDDILRYNRDWKAILAKVKEWQRNKEREEPDQKWWPIASTFFNQRLWETDDFSGGLLKLDATYWGEIWSGPDAERAKALCQAGRLKRIGEVYYEVKGVG